MFCATLLTLSLGATPFKHGWDTVADVMGMHGKFDASKTTPAQVDTGMAWAAHHYATITTGTGCKGTVTGAPGHTIEDAVRAAAVAAKKANPAVKV